MKIEKILGKYPASEKLKRRLEELEEKRELVEWLKI